MVAHQLGETAAKQQSTVGDIFKTIICFLF